MANTLASSDTAPLSSVIICCTIVITLIMGKLNFFSHYKFLAAILFIGVLHLVKAFE
jgi:hypothetical protein